jgi:DNA polymerase III subunit alpha
VVINLSDGTATQEVTVYNEVFDQYRDLIKEDAVVVIEAKVRLVRRSSGDDGETVFMRVAAERVCDLATARSRFAREMRLVMNGEASREAAQATAKLKELLAPYRNCPCPVAINYQNGTASVQMRLGDGWKVSLDDRLLASLRQWLKPENVEVLYS